LFLTLFFCEETLIQGLQKERSELKAKYKRILEEYHNSTASMINANPNASNFTNSQSSEIQRDTTTSLLLPHPKYSISTVSKSVLHQSVLFQRIHHLLLQHEKFIRDLHHVISLYFYSFYYRIVFTLYFDFLSN
jgi:hypothetical protein